MFRLNRLIACFAREGSGFLQLNFVYMHKKFCSLAIAFMHDVGYSENLVRETG